MAIRWITPQLGTAPAQEVINRKDITIIDVRDLVDKGGNKTETIKNKISLGVASLQAGNTTVVCCDYGISRSNAVAAGILATFKEISFFDAVKIVQETTGETEIKIEPLEVVRRAVETEILRMDTSKPALLVTGSTGFVGTSLCELLKNTWNVITPARSEVDIEQGSTALYLQACAHNVKKVIHLASPRVYTSNIAMGKTLTMLQNVLDVCSANKIPLVYLSSWEIYSGYVGDLLVDENTPALPKGPYAYSKFLAEMLLQRVIDNTGLKCTLIRSSPLYGSDSDKPKFLYNFHSKAIQGEPIITHKYRNGSASLDLLHINDFTDALVKAVDADHDGILNIGSGASTSIMQIARMIKDLTRSTSQLGEVNIDSYTPRITMNHNKACRLLQWQPSLSLEQGLTELFLKTQHNNG